MCVMRSGALAAPGNASRLNILFVCLDEQRYLELSVCRLNKHDQENTYVETSIASSSASIFEDGVGGRSGSDGAAGHCGQRLG